jgi:serine protease Do
MDGPPRRFTPHDDDMQARIPALYPLALSLALGGCGSSAPPVPAAQSEPSGAPVEQGAALQDTPTAQSLPPLQLAAALPPAPVPATFDVATLADRVRPTVVNILTTQKVIARGGQPFEFFFGPEGPTPRGGERSGAGSGFIIDPAGYVVTNEHVVRDADRVTVRLADDRELEAQVVGRDPKLDLALLKLDGASDLPAAPLGSSETLRVGEHVLAVGNPFGLGHTVTLGIVSAKARTIGAGPYDDFIQTDASINPGNSGGPLFNWRGEVVGINTAIRPGANSIGFAIPVDALRDVLPQLRERGHVVRGKLGLVFQPVTPELAKALGLAQPRGALVAQVEPGGPAARAGIQPGDVIVKVGATDIVHAEELPRNVARNAPGSTLDVSYVRDGKPMGTRAVLAKLDDEPSASAPATKRAPAQSPASNKLGIQVSDEPGGGVRIDGVLPTSPLTDVRPGDVILEIAGKPVGDVDALGRVLTAAKPGATLLARIRRGDALRFAPIVVPR